jgi:hypothetical protein
MARKSSVRVPKGEENPPASAPEEKELEAPGPSTRIASGPVYVDGYMHFNQMDMLRYECAQLRVVNALQGIGLKKAEAEKAKREAEERQRLYQIEVADLASLAKKHEKELLALQEELASVYSVDFSQVTYDDVTGRISVLGEPVLGAQRPK